VVDLSVLIRDNPSSMITFLRYLLRLLPFSCGGHHQLALEDLALRQQLARVQTNRISAQTVPDGSPLVGRRSPESGLAVQGYLADGPRKASSVYSPGGTWRHRAGRACRRNWTLVQWNGTCPLSVPLRKGAPHAHTP
jgi:hypothetical protein